MQGISGGKLWTTGGVGGGLGTPILVGRRPPLPKMVVPQNTCLQSSEVGKGPHPQGPGEILLAKNAWYHNMAVCHTKRGARHEVGRQRLPDIDEVVAW